MKFNKTVFSVMMLLGSFAISVPQTYASVHYFCPLVSGFGGWWGSISPANRHCSTKYTWNTISGIGSEESNYIDTMHYIACGYSSFNDPGNITAKVYIPSPDNAQTNNGAHYYKWATGTNYLMIGSVNQYSVFGYANLSTVDWSQFDKFRITDATNDTVKYSKHVDVDEYAYECYFN